MSDLSASLRARGAALLRRLSRQRQTRSPAARWAILVAAVAIFAGSGWYAVHSLSGVPLASGWHLWLLATGALALVAFLINAVEFAMSARLLDVRAGAADSLRVSILGSAANILPVPGAALVRSAALKRMGFGYRAAMSMTAVVGLAWVATSGVIAGGLLLADGAAAVGGATLAAGLAGLAASFVLLASNGTWGGALRTFPLVLGVELASVGAGVVRSWTVLHALGIDAGFADASVLMAAAVVASAAGLMPGGLGLREALSAAVGAAVGLPAAIGLLVAAVDRVVGYVLLGAASAVVLMLTPESTRRTGASAAAAPNELAEQPGPP